MRMWVADSGSGNLLDPGSRIRDEKNSDLGSRINIPDPEHCLFHCTILIFISSFFYSEKFLTGRAF